MAKTMQEQVSMFGLLGMEETPVIPFDQQKKGTKGWVIEIQGIFAVEHGYKKNMVGVTTKEVILERDSYTRENRTLDRIEQWQSAHCTGKGGCKGDGWSGTPRKLYKKRPTWKECQEYARKQYKELWEIVYVRKDCHAMTHICEYEEGA